MLFNGWDPLIRTAIAACIGYFALIFIIRLSGKRTLSQLNAFDFVVTVAIGSILATFMLSKSTAISEGLLAMGMLVMLQFIVAWISKRFRWFSALVESEPRLLFHQGRYLDQALRIERVKREELRQVVRNQGIASMEGVEAIVLETNGKFSVIRQAGVEPFSAIEDIGKP